MASSSTFLDPIDDSAAASFRSRASSIITTTTNFSLETLSQDDQSSIGARWERQHRPGNAGRPHSVTSIAHPAPPYTEAVDSTLLPPNHGNRELPGLLSRLAAATERLEEAASINEPLAPSTIASGHTTPAPESPIGPEVDSQSQAAYYSNVVRTLDSNYTAELERLRQKQAQELAVMRHDIDQAYRAQWKAKNREIEKIREETAAARDLEVNQIRAESGSRIAGLEVKVQQLETTLAEQAEKMDKEHRLAIEKARHEIEDLWEKRWSDRTRVESEERERAEMKRQAELKDKLPRRKSGLLESLRDNSKIESSGINWYASSR
ncbi:MAG: hypothetical protein Q9182_000567 [Xanthomendoza sp. 2 TL-2023]